MELTRDGHRPRRRAQRSPRTSAAATRRRSRSSPRTRAAAPSCSLEEPGVVCGVPVAAAVFRALDPSVTVEATLEEGTAVSDVPAVVAVVEGPARAILTGERVALNLVGRLCGIASLTRRFVELTEGTPRPHPRHAQDDARACARSRSTPSAAAAARTTAPASTTAILIKDNHIRVAGGIAEALGALDGSAAALPVEIEAETLDAGARGGRRGRADGSCSTT